jgi:hypothetical protein
MNTTTFPEATTEKLPLTKQKRNRTKDILIGLLALALVGVSSYLVVDKNRSGDTILQQQSQIATVTTEKSELQKSFDGSLARLDSLAIIKTGLETKLTASKTEIDKDKKEIRTILNKKNATVAELSKAKGLIAQLNGRITGMEQDIARLTKENQGLTLDKQNLLADKEKLNQDLSTTNSAKQLLEKKVDIASTLNATNISITPIDIKHNGKEKVTAVAKRVNKMLIAFDVDNRIAETGKTDVFVCILGPDGKPISIEALGSGTFTTRDEGDKLFTAKVAVDLETGKKKNVEFAFIPKATFEKGNYTIQIYQNGYKIGERTTELKKGGLFS